MNSLVVSDSPQNQPNPFNLTDRENEVWKWIAEGKTNWEIGEIVECAAETAKKHVHHVLKKLGAPNRTCAAIMYRRGAGAV